MGVAGSGGGRNGVAAIASVCLSLMLGACQAPQPRLSPTQVRQAPVALDDGWTVATPSSQGLDPARLLAMYERIERGAHPGLDGVVVARNGVLVSERYFGGYDRTSLHEVRSLLKSITAVLAGIAVDRGVARLDDPVAPRLAGFHGLTDPEPLKQRITLRHLLEMRSGLDCSEMPGRAPYREGDAYLVWDWVAYHWEVPVIEPPGTTWRYCSGNTFLLGVVLSAALQSKAGMDLRAFAQRELFAPLQIRYYDIDATPDGHVTTPGNGHFLPRDLAKIGQLVLARGRWRDRQVVSAAWVAEMTAPRVATDWSWTRDLADYEGTQGNSAYGYQWFHVMLGSAGRDTAVHLAWGNGGQFIFVVPEHALVAVFTASNYGYDVIERQRQAIALLARYLIPAAAR